MPLLKKREPNAARAVPVLLHFVAFKVHLGKYALGPTEERSDESAMPSRAHVAVLLSITLTSACSTTPIPVAEQAVPVIREAKDGSWLASKKIVRFGAYEIADQQQSGTNASVRQASFTRDKLRKESSIQYTLRNNGVAVATVAGRTVRKMRKMPTRLGNITSDEFDVLDGQIQLAAGTTATFSLNDFNSRDLNAKAEGTIQVDSLTIAIREVDAPWNDYRSGFAGAEFFLNDRRIGQVLVRKMSMSGSNQLCQTMYGRSSMECAACF